MSNAWVFQANPKQYDVDAALEALDHIWWRVPQYTSEIQVGDLVVVWRSGKEAGVIGVGRVLAPPQLHVPDESEARFVVHPDEAPSSTTRVLVAVAPAHFIAKERVKAIPELSEHLIVTAPMGTVFRLSADEWAALGPHLPTPPEMGAGVGEVPLPPAFAWEQRAKGVLPMPGGYDGYLEAARRICVLVDDSRPTSQELVERLRLEFGVAEKAARLRESFLRKMGLIRVESGSCQVSEWGRRWLASADDQIVIALLHSRCRFIGEMVSELETPRTADELLSIINEFYGLAWDTHTQIVNRRGWLQSAGMVTTDGDGRLVSTDAGRAFVRRIDLHAPKASLPEEDRTAPLPAPEAEAEATVAPLEGTVTPAVEVLCREIEEAATDSLDPNRFERAVRDAFSFLGFDAEWLGGSGKTDVLLDAPLGKFDSYRVTVDAKTTGSGSVSDQQVDWTTLVEHRGKHEAEYTLLVAPNPSTGRLMERAVNHQVAVLSSKQLAGLCRQHARAPLGLADYRTMFMAGGEVNTTELDELADDGERLATLAAAVCELLAVNCATFGPLTARDLWLMLSTAESGDASSEEEIQGLVDTLSSPLVRAVSGTSSSGYVLACHPRVTQSRLRLLGVSLAGS